MPDETTPAPGLTCPSCRTSMRRMRLDGHYGTVVDIDLCTDCQGFWFDGREHLQLSAGATLRMFEIIHDARGGRRSLPDRLECPRCQIRLLATDDRQRATEFHYWRCARGHGRYITFFDFLREKNFIKPLDAGQLAELRSKVASVNCSNCGAPIELVKGTVCPYCHTPLAMLDFEQVNRTIGELRDAAERPRPEGPAADVALALALMRERQDVESLFRRLDASPDLTTSAATSGIVQDGLGAVVSLLRRLRG